MAKTRLRCQVSDPRPSSTREAGPHLVPLRGADGDAAQRNHPAERQNGERQVRPVLVQHLRERGDRRRWTQQRKRRERQERQVRAILPARDQTGADDEPHPDGQRDRSIQQGAIHRIVPLIGHQVDRSEPFQHVLPPDDGLRQEVLVGAHAHRAAGFAELERSHHLMTDDEVGDGHREERRQTSQGLPVQRLPCVREEMPHPAPGDRRLPDFEQEVDGETADRFDLGEQSEGVEQRRQPRDWSGALLPLRPHVQKNRGEQEGGCEQARPGREVIDDPRGGRVEGEDHRRHQGHEADVSPVFRPG